MKVKLTQMVKIVVLFWGMLGFVVNLNAEQAVLLLQSRAKTGILLIHEKKYIPLFEKTNYIQSSANGNIVYQATENADWQFAQLSLKNGKVELLSVNVPNELTGKDVFPAFSPDGTKLFWTKYGNVKSTIYIWDLLSRNMQLSKEIDGYVYLPAWAPDNKKIAFYLKEKSPIFTEDDYGFAVWDTVKNQIQKFPVSLPTRPSPQRDWSPIWSNNSQYAFYEGRYSLSKPQFEVLVDTVTGKAIPCDAGVWLNDSTLIYIASRGQAAYMNLYLNPLTDVINGKINLENPMGKVSASSFQASVLDRRSNALYFQSSNRVVSVYYLKSNTETPICKVDFNIQYMSCLYLKR